MAPGTDLKTFGIVVEQLNGDFVTVGIPATGATTTTEAPPADQPPSSALDPEIEGEKLNLFIEI